MIVRRTLAGVLVLFIGLAAIGYWKTQTQAWMQVLAIPARPGEPAARSSPIGLVFHDDQGKPLARAQLDVAGNLRFDGEFARCGEMAGSGGSGAAAAREWQECFDGISHWAAGWGGRVGSVNVASPGCPPRRIDTRLERNADGWWIWWLPWPHGGPTSYATYSLLLKLDEHGCTAGPVARVKDGW
ncbi:MAG: hypothetical protein HZB13_15315 [Acidobacteria bacterium]|nr:hypothetical protein [Acidobacteriota bacterium]